MNKRPTSPSTSEAPAKRVSLAPSAVEPRPSTSALLRTAAHPPRLRTAAPALGSYDVNAQRHREVQQSPTDFDAVLPTTMPIGPPNKGKIAGIDCQFLANPEHVVVIVQRCEMSLTRRLYLCVYKLGKPRKIQFASVADDVFNFFRIPHCDRSNPFMGTHPFAPFNFKLSETECKVVRINQDTGVEEPAHLPSCSKDGLHSRFEGYVKLILCDSHVCKSQQLP